MTHFEKYDTLIAFNFGPLESFDANPNIYVKNRDYTIYIDTTV
jgi:hypothetical protein